MKKFLVLAGATAALGLGTYGGAAAMPMSRQVFEPTAQVEAVAYRRHYTRRVYRGRSGYNPGAAAFVGAAAGLIGAGIAASQGPRYYGYPAYGYGGYPGYGYGGYGYGSPYYNGW